MLRTRSELDQAVFQLYAAVPLWRRECGSEPALRDQYRRLFDDVLGSASDDDFDYVVYQLGELAVSTGVFPTSPFEGMRGHA
jgi:hypothetical protein